MAKYIIGDIQGCFDSLQALLKKVHFDPNNDTLYCVGDLVNRGPKSLKTLRFLKNIGESCRVVLGNHDLHLISLYYNIRSGSKKDTIAKLLNSSDAKVLIEWLRSQPLMIYDETDKFIISHAGIYPQWNIKTALRYASLFSESLKSDSFKTILKKMYGNEPAQLTNESNNSAILRFTVNSFTRMRFCHKNGDLSFIEKGAPDLITTSSNQENDTLAWFQLPNKRPKDVSFFFGHWSSLGLYHHENIFCLDSGCVWGNKLSLYDLDNKKFISVKSKE